MALQEMQISVVLMATARLLSLTARKHPAFAARLKEKNLIAQIKVIESNQGRWFTLKDGKV